MHASIHTNPMHFIPFFFNFNVQSVQLIAFTVTCFGPKRCAHRRICRKRNFCRVKFLIVYGEIEKFNLIQSNPIQSIAMCNCSALFANKISIGIWY